MIHKLIVIILLLFNSIAYSQVSLSEKIDTLNQQELNEYKTKVEIKKIEDELSNKDYSIWFQTGTFFTAVLALIISIVTSNRSNKRQIEAQISNNNHNQKDRISNLLKELGSDSLSVKIAATQALSEYKSSFPFIINTLRIEKNQLFTDVVNKVLSSSPKLSVSLLVDETKTIHNKKLDIAGKLVALGNERKKIARELSLDNGELFEWIELKYGSRIKELTDVRIKNKIGSSGQTDSEVRKKEEDILYLEWEKLIIGQHNVITAIEEVIKESVRTGLKLNLNGAYLDGIMLTKTNLSGFSFNNVSLNYANFEGSIITESDFSGINARFMNMKNCKTTDTVFDNSILKNCDFRNSKGKRTSIQNSELLEPNFDRSNIKYIDFTKSKLIKMSIKNTLFVKGNFTGGLLHECDISATDLTESKFTNSRIISSNFSTTRIRKSNLQNCEIILTEIVKTSFDESDMSFCTLDKINSIDSQFSIVSLVHSKLTNVIFDEKTLIDGIDTTEATCINCSENLTNKINNYT